MIPAMSCVGHLKKNAKRKTVATKFIIKKYRDNLLVVGLLKNTNKAPTEFIITHYQTKMV